MNLPSAVSLALILMMTTSAAFQPATMPMKKLDPLTQIDTKDIRNKVERCINADYSLGIQDSCSLEEMETIMKDLQKQKELLSRSVQEVDNLFNALRKKSFP